MRKSSTNLHALIHKLTKAEKKQCTVCLKALGKQGEEYLNLFRQIDKQEQYDELALKRKIKTVSYSRLKRKLYALVLDTVVQAQLEEDIHSRLLYGLQKYHALYKKELYHQAHQLIYQLQELAQAHHQLELLQCINKLIIEIECNITSFEQYDKPAFEVLMDMLFQTNEQLHNKQNYHILSARLKYHLNKDKNFSTQKVFFNQLMKDPLLREESHALSWPAKLQYYLLHLIIAVCSEEHDKACECSLKIITIYEQHFLAHAPNQQTYLSYHFNAIVCATGALRAELCEELFSKASTLLSGNIPNSNYNKTILLGLQFNWYTFIGDTARGFQLLEAQEDFLATIQATPFFITLSISLAYLYIEVGDYDTAMEHLENVLAADEQMYYTIREGAQLMLLVCYYEKQEWSLLASLSRSLYRRYQPQTAQLEAELILVKLFQKLSKKWYSKEECCLVLKKAKNDLVLLKKQQPTALIQLCRHFDYLSWLESHISQQAFVDLLQKKVKLSTTVT